MFLSTTNSPETVLQYKHYLHAIYSVVLFKRISPFYYLVNLELDFRYNRHIFVEKQSMVMDNISGVAGRVKNGSAPTAMDLRARDDPRLDY